MLFQATAAIRSVMCSSNKFSQWLIFNDCLIFQCWRIAFFLLESEQYKPILHNVVQHLSSNLILTNIYIFSRRFYPKRLTFKLQFVLFFFFLSALDKQKLYQLLTNKTKEKMVFLSSAMSNFSVTLTKNSEQECNTIRSGGKCLESRLPRFYSILFNCWPRQLISYIAVLSIHLSIHPSFIPSYI